MDNKKMKILFTVGFLSLLHAAYSAAQRNFLAYTVVLNVSLYTHSLPTDRSYLRLTEQEFTSLPADVSEINNHVIFFIYSL